VKLHENSENQRKKTDKPVSFQEGFLCELRQNWVGGVFNAKNDNNRKKERTRLVMYVTKRYREERLGLIT
jgi:hypothetical protein